MNILKKRYKFIQTFDRDVVMGENTPIGFHIGGEKKWNKAVLEAGMNISLLPHYGFSFYDEPPGRVIRKGQGDVPSLFVSDRFMNLGRDSLVKTIKSIDIFSDYGLSLYRKLSFLMFMGFGDGLMADIGWLTESVPEEPGMNPAVDGLKTLAGSFPVNSPDLKEKIRENLAIYEEIHLRGEKGINAYLDAVYLTADMMTSIELSYVTVKHLIDSQGMGLAPMQQVPLMSADYDRILEDVFDFDENRAFMLSSHDRMFPIWGIAPGIYCYGKVLFDLAKGTISGKRNDLVRFILYLNGKNYLSERDLNYLI